MGLQVEGETEADLARIAEEDQRMARQGLVRLMRESGEVYDEYVEALTRALRPDRIRAEKAQVAWFKGGLEKLPWTAT